MERITLEIVHRDHAASCSVRGVWSEFAGDARQTAPLRVHLGSWTGLEREHVDLVVTAVVDALGKLPTPLPF